MSQFDKLRAMQVLVSVADSGSFTAAGRLMDLSPVMVGRHVAALEALLGARLIQRSTRRQAFTEVGQLYLAECRRVLELVRHAEQLAEGHAASPQGQLRISAPVTLGQCVFAPLLAELLQAHERLRADLHLSDAVVDLIGDGFDAAIRIGPVLNEGLVARPLRPYRLILAASPSYLAGAPALQDPQDLARHRCLNHTVWQQGSAWQAANGQTVHWPGQAVLSANHGDALRRAALAGAGIVLQPEVLLAEDLEAGRLRQVLPGCEPPGRPVHLLYPADRLRLPKLQAFIASSLARWGATEPPPPRPLGEL